tara:strand:+ start:3277 stop:4038 length:762 start_codon:yes stop_codon:yes gene_type:complete
MKNSEIESAPVAHVTTDYLIFNLINWNRDIDYGQVKKMCDAVKQGINFFKYVPILADKQGNVIDGQHRFKVCEMLGLPIYYHVVETSIKMIEIMKLNSSSSNWKWDNYVNAHIKVNGKNASQYKQLKSICSKYSLPKATIASILQDGNPNRVDSLKEAVQYGEFRINHYEKAIKFLDGMQIIRPTIGSKGVSRAIMSAFWQVKDNEDFSFKKFLHKANLKGTLLQNVDSKKQALLAIEDIYNFASKKRVILFN